MVRSYNTYTMMYTTKLFSFVCGFIIVGVSGGKLPSFIKPCSRSLPVDQLTDCVAIQAKNSLSQFVKGLPELNVEPLDPLSLNDITVKAGTFTINCKNLITKGLSKAAFPDSKFDLVKKEGYTKIFGNFTFISDYETDGQVFLLPIKGHGKLKVKMYNTEFISKWKIRMIKGEDGADHIETYDLKAGQTYGDVKIHLSNILGGSTLGETLNQVLNDNWRDVIADVGPPFTNAAMIKISEIINKFYLSVPFDELFTP